MDTTDLRALGIGVLLFGGYTHMSAETVFFSNEAGVFVMLVGLFVVSTSLVPGIGRRRLRRTFLTSAAVRSR